MTYIPEKFPRRRLPDSLSLETWDSIEPWYRELLDWRIESARDLEVWLEACGELNAAVSQEGVRRNVAMTQQTDDPEREAAHLAFVREIEPKLKPVRDALRSKYLDNPFRLDLPRDRFFVFDRAEENRRALFRAANVPRETELAELEQRYQKTIGAMTVMFRGEEKTPAQMAPILEEPDRSLRQEAWELVAARRALDREALDDLFDRMVELRTEVAHEAGFSNYVDYAYRARERFDYGTAEAERFRDAIERVVVPLADQIMERRRRAIGVESLRPWDLAVDPFGREPLRPFKNVDELAVRTKAIFDEIDRDLGDRFEFLRTHGLLDLENRKGKAPGGYQTTFEDDRLPFIFMNAVGLDGDVRTLLHEGGHAFHTLECRGEPLAAYREAPIEFCEVASMSMELLGARNLSMFYSPEDADRSYRRLLEGIVLIMPWIATVDAFQHWIYANPAKDRNDRRRRWIEIDRRFGGIVDWTGYEETRGSSWHKQLHIFLYPFYYIEYGIAQLGALHIWRRSLDDRQGAVAAYRSALALGGSRPLPELFAAAGARFDFDVETIEPLMARIAEELERIA